MKYIIVNWFITRINVRDTPFKNIKELISFVRSSTHCMRKYICLKYKKLHDIYIFQEYQFEIGSVVSKTFKNWHCSTFYLIDLDYFVRQSTDILQRLFTMFQDILFSLNFTLFFFNFFFRVTWNLCILMHKPQHLWTQGKWSMPTYLHGLIIQFWYCIA